MHPPKVETFDVAAGTNTDPKGFVRSVDVYREEPFGLFLSREMVDHPRCTWVESWLLPDLGIRVTDWSWTPGEERDQDYYIDIVAIDRAGAVWRTTDHYLDIVATAGLTPQILDTDEFAAAVGLGLLDPATADLALQTSYRVVIGITEHGNDLDAWLDALGVTLQWRRR